MSAVLDSWKLCPRVLLVSFLWLIPLAFCHSDLPVYFSLSLPCASTEQVLSATEWSHPDFLEAVSTGAHLSSIWPRCVRSSWKSLHNMHSNRMLACQVDDGRPYLHKSLSDSSGKYPSMHGVRE